MAGPTVDVPAEIVYRIRHRTTYVYSTPVIDAYSVANLLPRSTPQQTVVSAEVVSDPPPDEFDERHDAFGNRVVQLGLHHPHDRFELVATSEVNVRTQQLPDTSPPWEQVVAQAAAARGDTLLVVGPFLAITASVAPASNGALLDELSRDEFVPERPVLDVVAGVCSAIYRELSFDPTSTDVTTPLDDVLLARRGVCQDFAHLAIAVFRRRGLPARYVSGYIETDPPPGEPKSIGADASHAWCSVWVPETGWCDVDPTNDQLPTTRHVTVAWGRDYRDVAPVRGVVIGPNAAQSLDVGVDVHRRHSGPVSPDEDRHH